MVQRILTVKNFGVHIARSPNTPKRSIEKFEELNKEEIERLRNFVSNLDKQLGMCSLAQTSKSSISHTIRASYLPFTITWVIGSRATSHMIHFSHCFSSYNPCPNNKKIFIVYGSFTTVTSQGKINPT
ncbi:unnamed protein product, partial [Vitis vinifera]